MELVLQSFLIMVLLALLRGDLFIHHFEDLYANEDGRQVKLAIMEKVLNHRFAIPMIVEPMRNQY